MARARKEYIILAAEHVSDLNLLYAVIAILEGGTLHAPSNTAAQRIIGICKTEAQKRLRDYDKAVEMAVRP